jgi:hypothetical protein
MRHHTQATVAQLYAAHRRVEAAADRFVRIGLSANRGGFHSLAELAERCATRCLEQARRLEHQIIERL